MSLDAKSALVKLCQAGLRAVAWNQLVHDALHYLRGVTSCDVAAYYTSSGGLLRLQERVRRAGGIEAIPALDSELARTVVSSDTEPREFYGASGAAGRFDLAIALRSDDETVGVLAVSSLERFEPSHRTFLRELAEILALSRRAERQRSAAEYAFKRVRYIFEFNPNPMMLIDATTLRYLDVNQTAIDVYGYTREQWLAMTPYEIRASGYAESLESKFGTARRDAATTVDTVHRRADGSTLDAHVTSVTVERETGKMYIVTVQDMTERNEALARAVQSESQLAHDALYDRLTGLPNHALLSQRLTAAIASARASDRMAAVLFIDFDGFKNVNDTMGHQAGDALLKVIAERLRANTRQVDCIARMGGDEFLAILGDIDDAQRAGEIARHLGRMIAEPVILPGGAVTVTCSVGIAMFPKDGDDAETLIRDADIAMYQAKRDGRATARFFTPAMHHAAEHRLRLEGRLRKALDDDEFQLVYQPIYGFDGVLLASEALIRWPQPDGTVIEPDVFIPHAEESELIVSIGAWVLRTACHQNAAWSRASRPLRVNVNVSARQLADPHFARTVRQALNSSRLPPELLELELTETIMSANVERTAVVIEELRQLGVRVAIDDFGTGYNSLAVLRSYTVDTLKLDKCFVVDVASSRVDHAIAAAVVGAAHHLGATVIAEGVETEAQRAALSALTCDAAQGFLFGRPMTAEAFSQLLWADALARRHVHEGRVPPQNGAGVHGKRNGLVTVHDR